MTKPSPMRIGILTNVETRHRYFVNRLRAAADVVAVGYEQVAYHPARINGFDLTPEEARVVANHFEDRARQENEYFGQKSELVVAHRGCAVRHVLNGVLNTPSTLEFLRREAVDTLVVFGTNLIRPPLLGHWPGRMINLHLGLSPYYRGTATNFYPLLNEEPQYVGATIHLLDAGIDSGPILRHARPDICADDMPHTIGCKAILAGIEKLMAVLPEWWGGRLLPVTQWPAPNARVYFRRDYHPRQVVELYRKLGEGLIPRYVQRARSAAPAIRLVQ